ncbi:MAG: Lrp/AsnC family transcriptional regulator [Thermomicrobiales bacterium]|nr:Lrp/AsnC family transcriptional regulator [Thermomicrobiales bacterium]
MSQIDSIDERILAELQANGRLTMKSLAERVGLSSPAMIERVRRLEDRGVIAGYRAIVAPEALGRPVAAMVAATVQRGSYESFLDAVKGDSGVVECHRVTGGATYLMRVQVADMAALEELVDRLSDTGATCETSIVLSSPVPWREVTPPAGATEQRARLTRRRRRTGSAAEDEATAAPRPKRRGPGRPRGSKSSV